MRRRYISKERQKSLHRLLNESKMQSNHENRPSFLYVMINIFFLAILNFGFVALIGMLTIDSLATAPTKIAALLLSFFVSYFLVSLTPKMDSAHRLLNFGTGLILYLLMGLFLIGLPAALTSAMIPSILVAMATLFYGDILIQNHQQEEDLDEYV